MISDQLISGVLRIVPEQGTMEPNANAWPAGEDVLSRSIPSAEDYRRVFGDRLLRRRGSLRGQAIGDRSSSNFATRLSPVDRCFVRL